MKSWNNVTRAGALAAAVLLVAAVDPPVHGQDREARVVRAPGVFPGHGGEIGVSVRDVEGEGATRGNAAGAPGVIIDRVTPGSPAEKAGIKQGDVVVEFDGERVRSVRQFTRLVQETPPGRRVPAAVTRDGQRITVQVEPRAADPIRLLGNLDSAPVLGDLTREFDFAFPTPPDPPPPPAPAPRAPRAPAFPMPPDIQNYMGRFEGGLGITVSSLSNQLAEYFGVKQGVLVTEVREDSAAHSAGFKAGDVLTTLNGSEVSAPSDVRQRTQRLQDGDEFTAEVVRDRKPVTLKGKFERRANRGATRISL
jgi:serine protease Do